MRTICRILFYDVILALVYISFDIYLAWSYFNAGHKWWGALTLGAIAIPGTLEFLCYSYWFLHGDLEGTRSEQIKEYLFWAVLFGPFLFPISLVIWHIAKICQGEESFHKFETISRSTVLSTLSVLTKSCMQLILQVTIMMITWYNNNSVIYHSYQLTSVGISSIIIAKSCADHHYFEVSGKCVRERSPYCQLLTRMFLNLLHIGCRGIVFALLASYLHYLSIAFIGTMILCNYIISNIIIKTDGAKHFWTAFAAVLLPNSFISRDTVDLQGRQRTREMFRTFAKANSLLFLFLIGIGALVTTNCLLTLTNFIEFNCKNYPFLSYDPQQDCPVESPLKTPPASFFPEPHSWWFLIGNVGVILLSILHVILVFAGEHCLGKEYEPVPRL